MLKYKFYFFIFLFFLFISPYGYLEEINVSQENYSQNLDFDVIKAKYMDVNVLISIPVYVESYSDNSSFVLTTPIFIDTPTQKTKVDAYYYEDDQKIQANFLEDEQGNKFAEFEVSNISRNEYIFYINANIISENNIILKDEVYDLSNEIKEFEYFKQPTRYINFDQSEIRSVSNYLKKSDDALSEVVNITNWVYNYLEYDLSYASKIVEATNVLSLRKGVCSEYSILTAALLRDRGIPTRYVTGYANSTVEWQAHAWIEAYIPGQGWIGVDPTFGEVGFLDASHLAMLKTQDPSDIKDKINAYGKVSLSFGEKNSVFIINDQKSFSDIGYNNAISVNLVYPSKIKEKSAFYITAKITNTTLNPLTLLFMLNLHKDFNIVYPESNTEILYLKPFEEKEINFYINIFDINVPEKYYSTYNFYLISQIEDFLGDFSIYKNDGYFQEAFFISKPLISFIDDYLYFDMDFFNYTEENKNVVLKINNNGEVLNQTIDVPSKSSTNISKNFDYVKDSNFLIELSGDYNFSEKFYIFDDNEVVIINSDENLNDDEVIDENINSEIWEEDYFEKKEFKDIRNSLVVGGLLIFCFLILTFFVYYLKNKE